MVLNRTCLVDETPGGEIFPAFLGVSVQGCTLPWEGSQLSVAENLKTRPDGGRVSSGDPIAAGRGHSTGHAVTIVKVPVERPDDIRRLLVAKRPERADHRARAPLEEGSSKPQEPFPANQLTRGAVACGKKDD